MSYFSYSNAPHPIRADLAEAHRTYWEELSRAGAWWTGEERVAIAGETRRARECSLCRERKQALSPSMVDGEHDHAGPLSAPVVDVVHRIVTDASRLSKGWLEKLEADGLSDAHYVEIVGIVTSVVSIDGIHRALGLPPEPLPKPQAGHPSHQRPASALPGGAWVPWILGSAAKGSEADLYPPGPQTPNVYMAMSLVPDAVRAMGRLSEAHYLEPALVALPDASQPGRAIDRPQAELIAARVSALNECFY
jgi:hypothetical protein